MDPAVIVSGFPGVEEFPGLSDAWHWSPAPGLDFAAALSEDRRLLFQVNARDSYEEGLVGSLLVAARASEFQIASEDAFLVAVPGFRHPGTGFDVFGVARPGVHRYHEVRQPGLQEMTWAIFPGYECEFAPPGSYSLEDARESFIRFLTPADLRRSPAPFLRVRFDNTVTRGGTDGPDGVLVVPGTLYRELGLLNGAPGSFVEFENFRGQTFRVEWDGDWILSGGGADVRRIGLDGLLDFAAEVLNA
ncbi:hypothetical protein [Streptomyces sp. NPDC086182]|uniref:hypothetical protein n=1 Tax=Streptomyces sp. NPDC086182 TaxID=3155058 RepID=UPI003418BEB0